MHLFLAMSAVLSLQMLMNVIHLERAVRSVTTPKGVLNVFAVKVTSWNLINAPAKLKVIIRLNKELYRF